MAIGYSDGTAYESEAHELIDEPILVNGEPVVKKTKNG